MHRIDINKTTQLKRASLCHIKIRYHGCLRVKTYHKLTIFISRIS